MEDYVTCSGCKSDVALPRHTVLGEIVKCPGCGLGIEILSLGPFIPDSAVPEDWGEPRYETLSSSFSKQGRYLL
jgi:lysine biosynthesis protein LysW